MTPDQHVAKAKRLTGSLAKCTDRDHGLRAQRAFRDLWSDR